MIKIESNGYILKLYPATTVRIELNHPLFDPEAILPDIVYPFDVPVQGNEDFFLHAHLLESTVKYKIYSVTFSIDDWQPFPNSELVVLYATPQIIKISIISNLFGRDYRNKNLNEIEWPASYDFGNSNHNILAGLYHTYNLLSYPDANFCFPSIYWPDFYVDDKNLFADDIVNKHNGTEFFYNQGNSFGYVKNEYTIVPQPYLFFIVDSVFRGKLNGTANVDNDLKRICILNNTPLESKFNYSFQDVIVAITPNADFLFATDTTKKEKILASDAPPGTDLSGLWDNSVSEYRIPYAGKINIFFSVSLELYLTLLGGNYYMDFEIWKANPEQLVHSVEFPRVWAGTVNVNGSYEFTALPEDIGKVLFFRIAGSKDGVFAMVQIYQTNISILAQEVQFHNKYNRTVEYKNIVPSVTVANFINALRTTFGIYFTKQYGTENHTLYFAKDLHASDDYEDITHYYNESYEIKFDDLKQVVASFESISEEDYKLKPKTETFPEQLNRKEAALQNNINQKYLTTKENGIMQYSFVKDGNDWRLFYPNVLDVVFNPNRPYNLINWKIGIAPTNMYFFQTLSDIVNDQIMPKVQIAGNTKVFGNENVIEQLRMFFYYGMQQDKDNSQYPFASTSYLTPKNIVLGNTLLGSQGANNFIDRYLKAHLQFIANAQEVKFNFKIDMHFLRNFNFNRKKMIVNQKYIVKKLSVEYHNLKGIVSSEIIALK